MDMFIGRYPYFCSALLILIGLYGIFVKQNLVKKLIGMSIMQSAIILFFIVHAHKWSGTVPVWDAVIGSDATHYTNPIPHALMLTAIVVSVAITGVALVMIRRIYQEYRSLDEAELLNAIVQKENEAS